MESQDKAGNFIGYLFCENQNLSVHLVAEGYASMHFTADRSNYCNQVRYNKIDRLPGLITVTHKWDFLLRSKTRKTTRSLLRRGSGRITCRRLPSRRWRSSRRRRWTASARLDIFESRASINFVWNVVTVSERTSELLSIQTRRLLSPRSM